MDTGKEELALEPESESLLEFELESELESELELELELELPPPPPPPMGICFLLLSSPKRVVVVSQQLWPPLSSGRFPSQHHELGLHSFMASLPTAVLPMEARVSVWPQRNGLMKDHLTIRTDLWTAVGLPALICAGVSCIPFFLREVAEPVVLTLPAAWAAGGVAAVAAGYILLFRNIAVGVVALLARRHCDGRKVTDVCLCVTTSSVAGKCSDGSSHETRLERRRD